MEKQAKILMLGVSTSNGTKGLHLTRKHEGACEQSLPKGIRIADFDYGVYDCHPVPYYANRMKRIGTPLDFQEEDILRFEYEWFDIPSSNTPTKHRMVTDGDVSLFYGYEKPFEEELISVCDIVDVLLPSGESSFVLVSDEGYDRIGEKAILIARIVELVYGKQTVDDVAFASKTVPVWHLLESDVFTKSLLKTFTNRVAIESDRRTAFLRFLAENLQGAEALYNSEVFLPEQVVERFLAISSNRLEQEVDEVASDAFIDHLKATDTYQTVLQRMNDKGRKISETQQFNALQTACVFLNFSVRNRYAFNLSDMGSGKTLMTVETVRVTDGVQVEKGLRIFDEKGAEVPETLRIADKVVIAPALSIRSSWLESFEEFYEEVVRDAHDEHLYHLSFTIGETKAEGRLYLVGYTSTATSIVVDHVPEVEDDVTVDVIVDEFHQLSVRPMRLNKFVKGIADASHTRRILLSGTASNLTVSEWLNIADMFQVGQLPKSDTTPAGFENLAKELRIDIKKGYYDSLGNKRLVNDTFDCVPFEETKMTARLRYYNNLFNTVFVSVNGSNETETLTLSDTLQNVRIGADYSRILNGSDVVNTELFYKMVGDRAVTANSQLIASELFGEANRQADPMLIQAKSSLSHEDIELMKTVYAIANDTHAYKSANIGRELINALLNANDGLGNSIYSVLSKRANSNTKFLSYLSEQATDVLVDLRSSGLVESPVLEETEKFKILQSILAEEPDETYLIVVNDYNAVKKLSAALDIPCLKKAELKSVYTYQETLDKMFEQSNIVIVPQSMIKSSLDLIQANRLIQYQLNVDIADIIQSQNRINRIGQTRETKAFYIATDELQESVVALLLETYKAIRVAHNGIAELFVNAADNMTVVSDFFNKAFDNLEKEVVSDETLIEPTPNETPKEETPSEDSSVETEPTPEQTEEEESSLELREEITDLVPTGQDQDTASVSFCFTVWCKQLV